MNCNKLQCICIITQINTIISSNGTHRIFQWGEVNEKIYIEHILIDKA